MYASNAGGAADTVDQQFQAIEGAGSLIIWRAAPDGTPLYDCQWQRTFGNDGAAHHSETWLTYLHPRDQERVRPQWRQAIAAGTTFEAIYRVGDAASGFRWMHGRGVPLKNDDGSVREWIGTVADIHDRTEAQFALAQSEERLRLALASAEFGIWDVDLLTGRVWCSELAAATLGVPADRPLRASAFLRLVHAHDLASLKALHNAARSSGPERRFEQQIRVVRPGGGHIWLGLSAQVIYDAAKRPVRIIGTVRDVTERHDREQQLHDWAYLDYVTGLPNRRRFMDEAEAMLRSGRQAAILLLDLDSFRDVNDSFGHHVGDRLLLDVGRRLRSAAPKGATVARIGGDEFVVLVPDTSDATAASAIAAAAIAAVAAPFVAAEQTVAQSASIGIALAAGERRSAQELLIEADLALCTAKAEGTSLIRLFTPRLKDDARERQDLSLELRRAFDRGEFELHQQPQIRLSDGVVAGLEALLRWRHPSRGLLTPGSFLPVLERSALAVAVGEWVIATACADGALLASAGHPLRMAVNLFSLQLGRGRLESTIRECLQKSGLTADRLEVEITERTLIGNDEQVVRELNQIRQLGVSIAFDDFGTGYASLSLLKRCPVTRLKIDKSFVQNICNSTEDAAIVDAVLSLARSFDLRVTAEGIESAEQADFLRRHGCDEGQGFLFGRPVPMRELGFLLPKHAEPKGESASSGAFA